MSSYILDFIIHEINLLNEIKNLKTPLWAMFKVDGSNQPIQTQKKNASEIIQYNFPVRIVLNLLDLSNAYLYVNFCTFSENSDQVISLGVSRVKVRSLPVGRPKKFSFPLMSTINTAITIATISITATFSAFIPNIQVQPNHSNWSEQNQHQNQNQNNGSYYSSPF